MHSHEASTGRWLIRKEFWKEVALPSGLREAMNPNWQGRVGTCFSWWWGQRQNKCKGSGAAMQSDCPQDSKRLVAPTVNPSLFSSVDRANTQRRELLGLFVVSRDHFFCFSSFLSVLTEGSIPPDNCMAAQNTTITMDSSTRPWVIVVIFITFVLFVCETQNCWGLVLTHHLST